jgi:hypothetical protein
VLYSPPVRLARVLLVAVALLGACNRGDGGRTDDTLPPRETTSTTMDYAVPDVIDVAYVEKVMEALDHVYGDAIRILARERQITKEFLEHLAAIYGSRFFSLAERLWVSEVADGLATIRTRPGNPRTTVQTIIRSDASCVVIAVDRDFSGVRTAAPSPTPQRYVALVPSSKNGTGWLMAYDGFREDGLPPEQPCS